MQTAAQRASYMAGDHSSRDRPRRLAPGIFFGRLSRRSACRTARITGQNAGILTSTPASTGGGITLQEPLSRSAPEDLGEVGEIRFDQPRESHGDLAIALDQRFRPD